jgi:hypothetical protein
MRIFKEKYKLEDWIVYACKKQKINITSFGLPNNPDDLHEFINYKLRNFENLIDEMIKNNNPAILKLKFNLTNSKKTNK